MVEEPWPANHQLVAIEKVEKRPLLARNRIHRDILEGREAEEEKEEEEEEDEEGEEEEGEGEGEGEEEADYGDEAEEEVFPPKDKLSHIPGDTRYFQHGENLRNRFNEVELDSFMKLLNVKPYK